MKSRQHLLYLAWLSAAASLPHAAHAAEDDKATELDPVVVSSSRASSKLSQTPQAIGAVKQPALERDKPRTMGDIINRIAGVYWNDLGNEQHSMGIRQPIGTQAVYQYLEDGIPIRPLGVFNHNSLNEVNMAGSDSVEVIKGPASSLYGSNAAGGTVNFLTARPSRDPQASLGLRHDGTAGYTRVDTAASDSWGRLGLRFSHYASRRSHDNWQEYSYGDKDSFTLRGDYALGASSQLRATLVHTDLDTAMTGSLFETDYRTAPGKSINTFTYRRDKTLRAALAWEGETFGTGISTLTLFLRHNDHGQIPSYTIGSCDAMDVCKGTRNNNHVGSLGFDLKHEQELAWLQSRLVAGLYVDHSDNDYLNENLVVTRDPATGRYTGYQLAAPLGSGARDYEAGIINHAVFAQWEFSPLQALRVVAGGRHDTIRYAFDNRLTPVAGANLGAPDETRDFGHFSPRLGASYALSKHNSVYGTISQGFTPPEVSQLYGKSEVPDLRPATYDNYEIGWRAALLDGALRLDSAIYRLDGRDTIVSYTVSPGNSENRNAGRTRSQGVEFGLNYEAAPWDLRLATTLARHRYLAYPVSAALDYSGKDMPQAPSDITSAECGYTFMPGTRLAVELVHVGGYWMNNANTAKYPGHTLLNLRAGHAFAKGWEAWLQVRNATDEHYADSASSTYSGSGVFDADRQNQYTPGAPRSVMLGLSYRYGGH